MGDAPDLLALLGNTANRAILAHLAVEPLYTRRLAELVGLSEQETSRRLRALEQVGVLSAQWANVGKTVRLYRLVSDRLDVRLTPHGVEVTGAALPAPPPPLPEPMPQAPLLVGRAHELAVLREMARTRGRVCVHGIGGVGKTSLVATLAAEWPGPVAWRTASPIGSMALLLRRLAATLRLHTRAAEPQEASALAEWLARTASASGALLVLDRAEVASPDVLEAFAEVASQMTRGAALVVSRSFPSELPRAFHTFELGGISRESAHELLGGADVSRVDALHALVGGHPLSLLLAKGSLLHDAEPQASLRDSGMREFLLQDCLAQLQAEDRGALLPLCILDLPFTVEEAATVAALARPHDALLRLAARGLVVRGPEGWLVHDAVRAALASDAPASAHRLAAQAFADSEDPSRGLAALRHALAAKDARLAAGLVEREATQRAHRFAEFGLGDAYGRLLDEVGVLALSPTQRAAVFIEQARLSPDAPLLERARPFVPATGALRARFLFEAAAHARRRGDPRVAIELLERVGDHAALPRLAADALLERAMLAEELEPSLVRKAFDEALAAAERSDDPRLLALAYAGAARARRRTGEDARALAEEALRLALLCGHLRGEAMARTTLTEPSLHPGASREAAEEGRTHARATLAIARRLKDPWLLACALTDVGILAARLGDLQEAEHAGAEGREVAASVGSRYLRAGCSVALAEAMVGRGEAAAARAMLQASIDDFEEETSEPPPVFAIVWLALARACDAAGDAPAGDIARARAARMSAQ